MATYKLKNRRQRILLGLINAAGYLIWGWSKIGRQWPKNFDPKNILVLQLDEIGDVLLSTPALRLLRQIYPKAKIIVAVRRPGYEILSGNPDIDQLHLVDLPRFSATTGGMKTDFNLIRQALPKIKAELPASIDLGLDLRADLRTIYLLKKLGIPQRVSQAIRGGGFWLTGVAPYHGLQHEAERKLGLVRSLRPTVALPKNLKLEIALDSHAKNRAAEALSQCGIHPGDNYTVIHPFAGWKPKEWPANRFAQIAKSLVTDYRQTVMVIGTEKEKNAAQEIVRAAGRQAFNLAGYLDLKATAAVIAGAKLFIGNDSGPLHIACATQTPAIALFGQNTPKRYGPWQNRNITIYHPVECSPCPQTKCERRPSCLELITTDEVIAAISKIFNS